MSGASEVAGAVDSDALVELVREAVRIPSVTPNEEAFANWVFGRINESEAFGESELVECAPNRPNVHGSAGGGSGRSLLLAGHLDTVATDDWTEHWQGTDREDPFAQTLAVIDPLDVVAVVPILDSELPSPWRPLLLAQSRSSSLPPDLPPTGLRGCLAVAVQREPHVTQVFVRSPCQILCYRRRSAATITRQSTPSSEEGTV